MSSSVVTLGLLASSTISLILMLTFNALSGSGMGGDLFIASVSDQSDRYQTLITPAGQHTKHLTILTRSQKSEFTVYQVGPSLSGHSYSCGWHLGSSSLS